MSKNVWTMSITLKYYEIFPFLLNCYRSNAYFEIPILLVLFFAFYANSASNDMNQLFSYGLYIFTRNKFLNLPFTSSYTILFVQIQTCNGQFLQ